jgi:PhnB protein
MSNPTTDAVLAPHLIVKDAARAIAFYVEALGARELSRATDHKLGGLIVHAELALGAARFSLSEEARDWKNDAPTSLGGSPVVLTLTVADARAVGARMERAGATVVFPIADQFYGKRQGRLRDPFGHLWIVSQELEALSPEEVQRRVDAFHDER